MKHLFTLCLFLPLTCMAEVWPLDAVDDTLLLHGEAKPAPGAAAQSLVLDGGSVIELKNSSALACGSSFTASVWFNPYLLHGGQQMIIGKNRYSLRERQWGITIEPDGRLRAHLQQKGRWSEITCAQPLLAGRWHLATLVVTADQSALYLNGQPAGEVKLTQPIPTTAAPVTLGGIYDEAKPRQQFIGALDEARIEPRALSAAEIAASYHPVAATHEIAKFFTADFPLWDSTQKLPAAAELPVVQGTEFHVIKKKAPDVDGCRWTLGVGLAWHKGRLYASYGFNKGDENTPTEEAHVRISSDAGRSWGSPVVMDAGEGSLGVSHGVFLSHKDRLWAFMGAFYDRFQRTHTRAYTLNENTGSWEPHGVVIDAGFWPMQEPQKMADGNWIMAGARVSKGYDLSGDPPAVAISHGDDFTHWDLVVIPVVRGLGSVWGESTVIVDGRRIINISRYGRRAQALVAVSEDYGRTWKPSAPSNLPMATSKPYAGTLSTGQRYLVCTTTADTGGRRSPLTIAVSRPGENVFSKVFLIRPSVFEGTPGVSDARADFSYPYAVEHEGRLYIGYTHKSHAANELAVVPVAALAQAASAKTTATTSAEPLWVGETDLSRNENIPFLPAEHRVIDECTAGEFQFTLGADIVFHEGEFIAQWANSRVEENDEFSLARGRRSRDGIIWSDREVIAPGFEGPGFHSHGVFHSHEGVLWSFNAQIRQQPRLRGFFSGLCTDAFLWKPDTKAWEPHTTTGLEGFWPLGKPVRLGNGKWIMAGARNDAKTVLAAVAICDGADITRWRVITLPHPATLDPAQIWGETTVSVEGPRVLAIVRNGKKGGTGFWCSISPDHGETWPELRESNLPHGGGRPMLGRLADGRHFLVGNVRSRNMLVLALTRPGTFEFDRMYRLIDRPSPPVRMPAKAKRSQWAYPSAVEHAGRLYIVYSITKEATGLTVVDLSRTVAQ